MTFAEYAATHAPLDIQPAIAAACCSRGKRKGRVLASAPCAKGPEAVGAWRSLMGDLAPTRAGLFGFAFFSGPEERQMFEAVEKWLSSTAEARHALQCRGQGYLEFNLHAWHCAACAKGEQA